MDDKTYLVITLRREVTDNEQGKAIFDMVKTRLADQPEVKISGLVSNHFALESEPT